MAKKTAVVDLGPSSIRMIVLEKTSRYGFYTAAEFKREVRLDEDAYNNGRILQEEAVQRAENVLRYFKECAYKHKCRKIFIAGTSALRDAPNSRDFIQRTKERLGLNTRCIDGKSESYLGGLTALNLFNPLKNATTLDIGGGSSELCLIKDNKIVDYISLDIGTIRLKELFYDTNKLGNTEVSLKSILEQIPTHFCNDNLIAIGGSLRAISNSIMQKNSYPLKSLHDYHYNFKGEKQHIIETLSADARVLTNFGIKRERFDAT